jgi:hypothetical protein
MTDAARSGAERRRAERTEPGPLRVRLLGRWEGVLINISTLGALVQLPIPQPVNSHITLDVEFESSTLQIAGRVVRSNPFPLGGRPAAPLAPTDYYVAVEFEEALPGID